MDGYALPLTVNEAKNSKNLSYDFIRSNKGRLLPFSFEESSIDLAVVTTPRVVIDNYVYEIARQYFVRLGGSQTERIVLLTPIMTETENPQLFGLEPGGLTSDDKPLSDGSGVSMYTSRGTLTNAAKEEVGVITEEIIDERELTSKSDVENILTEKDFATKNEAKNITNEIIEDGDLASKADVKSIVSGTMIEKGIPSIERIN